MELLIRPLASAVSRHHSRILFRKRLFMMASISSQGTQPFQPKKALVLTKFSRYEFERRRHPGLTEEELIRNQRNTDVNANNALGKQRRPLTARGSDYKILLHHHKIHTKHRDNVVETLRANNIETRLVDRFDYTDANIEWADVILTTGGDGTFLMAASKIHSRDKPVIGINSDPSRSVGYLCLPGKYTEDFSAALRRLLSGNFQWSHRQRIRVSIRGDHAFDPPIELHNQQLQYPEYRFMDCYQEQEHMRQNKTDVTSSDAPTHLLPVRALNEVFVGESLSSRVSYYEISVDGAPRIKLKSSGLTVCTGTGSTSWSFNINKVTPQCVRQILNIVSSESGQDVRHDSEFVDKVTNTFNSSLVFDHSKCLMAYTIRDPVVFGTDFSSAPRGFARRIEVRSRMFDASLVIDGGLSFVFNDGAVAVFEIVDDDALRTVILPD